MKFTITGEQIIGFAHQAKGLETFHSVDASTGTPSEYLFTKATLDEVDQACELAARAFAIYRKRSGKERAAFLDAIAEEIASVGDFLIEVCSRETALPKQRIQGERQQIRIVPHPNRISVRCIWESVQWLFLQQAIFHWLFLLPVVTRHLRLQRDVLLW
jgi:hypothetical protein